MIEQRVIFDYHTHTAYSDGKGTIENNVRAAIQRGLSGIAISDHGPGHLLNGVKDEKLREMRDEVERLHGIYEDIEIFLSVEANIVSSGNCLDIDGTRFEDYDFIIAGYHYAARNGNSAANFIHNKVPAGLPGRSGLKSRNTDMAVRAIYENPIKILTHPGDKGIFDMEELARACADRGTWMEINERHVSLTCGDIRQAANTGVKFVISSDAHRPERVGSCSRSIEKALEAGLDPGRIVNITGF